ncbi:MAG: YicC family protein [Bacteroides sp.]|nr:YicC family protein [Prevotella sp.]MCM1407256.1 YicC family protein [Treponema brennaborense]MCM1469744.1 YicC family protein [Bacteroides sp.]
MNSMTGYSYIEESCGQISVSVEMKSYNSRFLELSVNLPPYLNRLERYFRDKCTAAVFRGKMDVYIKIRESDIPVTIEAGLETAKTYYAAIEKIMQAVGMTGSVPAEWILSQDGVLTMRKEYDIEKYQSVIDPVFDKSLTAFLKDRSREGDNLKIDLIHSLSEIEEAAAVFAAWQPKMEELFKSNITKRFRELLDENIDEQRILQETAAMLMKYTINEEIVRLYSHIDALKHELETNDTPGRKIDFLCQELNREINTIGSKNQIVEVGQAVVSAKNALENIREQARNIE